MKVTVCTIAIGDYYARAAARMIQRFHDIDPSVEVVAWVNAVPYPTCENCIYNGFNYTPYAAKPAAMVEASVESDEYGISAPDVVILLDAPFYPIRPITPLVDHILKHGYFLCRNGNRVGEWISEDCLKQFELTRDEAMQIEEVSSYCIGVKPDRDGIRLLDGWHSWTNPSTICAPHTNIGGGRIVPANARNPGWCSDDPRCKGHRHDQTVLSIVAHRIGLTELVCRPKFTAYKGHETHETVLVDDGDLRRR